MLAASIESTGVLLHCVSPVAAAVPFVLYCADSACLYARLAGLLAGWLGDWLAGWIVDWLGGLVNGSWMAG